MQVVAVGLVWLGPFFVAVSCSLLLHHLGVRMHGFCLLFKLDSFVGRLLMMFNGGLELEQRERDCMVLSCYLHYLFFSYSDFCSACSSIRLSWGWALSGWA